MKSVYVICLRTAVGLAAPIKLGISNSPEKRLRALQTACPYPLALAAAFICPSDGMAADVERQFHRRHGDRRTSGEWFEIDPAYAVQFANFLITAGLVLAGGMSMEEVDAQRAELGLDNFGHHLQPGAVH